MKKLKIKVVLLFFILSVFCTTVFHAYAAGAASISGNSTATPGQTVTLVLKINPGGQAVSFQGNISCSGGAKLLSVSPSAGSLTPNVNGSRFSLSGAGKSSSASVKIVIKTSNAVGATNTVTASGLEFGDLSFNSHEVSSCSKSIKIVAPGTPTTKESPNYKPIEESTTKANAPSNNNLKSLSVEGYSLSPEFNPANLTYSLSSVPFDVETVKVIAKAEDSKAKVEIFGDHLAIGENIIMVRVTAQNGAIKTYNIKTVRGEDPNKKISDNAYLKDITLSKGILSPEFKKNKYEYVVYLPYEVNKISLTGIAESDKVSSIDGNVNEKSLQVGNNTFKIKVIAEDKKSNKEYVVNVVRMPLFSGASSLVTPDGKIGDKKFVIYLLIVGLLSLLTGVLITLLIENFKKNKSKNKTEKTKSKNTEMLKTEKENLDFEDKYIIKQNENIKETKEKKKETDLSNDDFFNKYLD